MKCFRRNVFIENVSSKTFHRNAFDQIFSIKLSKNSRNEEITHSGPGIRSDN